MTRVPIGQVLVQEVLTRYAMIRGALSESM
jgi:hypothetical protein